MKIQTSQLTSIVQTRGEVWINLVDAGSQKTVNTRLVSCIQYSENNYFLANGQALGSVPRSFKIHCESYNIER